MGPAHSGSPPVKRALWCVQEIRPWTVLCRRLLVRLAKTVDIILGSNVCALSASQYAMLVI